MHNFFHVVNIYNRTMSEGQIESQEAVFNSRGPVGLRQSDRRRLRHDIETDRDSRLQTNRYGRSWGK